MKVKTSIKAGRQTSPTLVPTIAVGGAPPTLVYGSQGPVHGFKNLSPRSFRPGARAIILC
jgi:hypothetical protein